MKIQKTRADSSLQETQTPKAKANFWPHNFHISTDCVLHMEKVFSIVRQKIWFQFTTTDWQQLMWRETTLLTDKAVQFATAETYIFSDSVLCLGGISSEPVAACEKVYGITFLWSIGSDRRRADRI